MKRFLSIIYFLLIIMNVKAQFLKGDMNEDGTIDIEDITLLIDCYLETNGSKDSIDIDNYDLSPKAVISNFCHLPVMEIITPHGDDITDKNEYMDDVGITLYDSNGEILIRSTAQVRGRGNTSWKRFPKKSYKIKFSKKQSLFGEHKDKTWVLLANYNDKTSLRNDLAFWMGRNLSNLAYTSSSHFIGLILNDKFLGLYQVAEQVKIAPYRVNVEEDGFLMEIDVRATDEDVHFSIPHCRYPIVIKDQSTDVLNKADSAYCAQYVNTADSVLFSSNYTDTEEGYAKYLDTDSFVDWMLINEIAKNNDAIFYSSCYMSLARGGKLKMGPLWDFDIAWGNVNYNDNDSPEGLWIGGETRWFKRLLKDRNFVNKTKERFEHFYSNKENIIKRIDSQSRLLRNPAYINNKIWKTFGTYVWPNPVWYDTYEEEVDYLKSWILKRLEWLKEYYDHL